MRDEDVVTNVRKWLAGLTRADLAAELDRVRVEKARRRLSWFARYGWANIEGSTELSWDFHLDAVCDHIQAQLEDWARARTYSAKEWAAMVERAVHTAVLRAQNQVINMPPRCLKTILVTICATAWAWVNWPEMRIMTFSSNPRVVTNASHTFMSLVRSPWYRSVSDAAADLREAAQVETGKLPRAARPGRLRWTIPRDPAESLIRTIWADGRPGGPGGWRASRGMESGFTGEGADWLLSDDPHNAKEVYSEPKRKSVHSKWDNELYSRVNDNTRSIRTIVMQRLHVDDLTAHVFAELLQLWVSISLSLEFDGHPPIAPQERKRRKDAGDDRVGTWLGWSDPRAAPDWDRGPILHPVRFPSIVVAQLKARRIVWASQFQQRPEKLAGGMFPASAWRFWVPSGYPTPDRPRPDGCPSREELPARVVPRDRFGRLAFDWVDLSIDATFKKTDDGSRVGILAIGGIGPDRFVIYDGSRRMDYPETKKAIRALVNADGAKIDPYATALDGARWRMTKVLIEDKANGSAAIDELRTSSDGGKWPGGVAIVAIETGDDSKTSRAVVMADSVQGGQWYLLDGARWLDSSCGDDDDLGFVAEFEPFPAGDHDDRIDSGSQCANHEATNQSTWTQVDWKS